MISRDRGVLVPMSLVGGGGGGGSGSGSQQEEEQVQQQGEQVEQQGGQVRLQLLPIMNNYLKIFKINQDKVFAYVLIA
ncbi:unnamed protein product [Adineta steineri]|uniref:Uncharacterized protein n=1 Tax=Adineta steineri TaxID=433720 RepID=A0A819VCU5_9BILA|nr:unnamed protein product [Adineta steineri]